MSFQLLRILAVISLVSSLALAIKPTQSLRNSAEDDLITKLPGLNDQVNFKQYSGYLKADDSKETNSFFHYWFVESQSNPSSDPVVLWLNGGPGCSSLEGFFAELGPFKVNQDGRSLSLNHYAWNKIANVLFLSSPGGVGFSYKKDQNYRTNDDETAKSNHAALKDFFSKFPQFKNNDLYLMGESYGGVYLPTLGVLVDQDKEMNLAGVGIGNGYLNANKLGESLIFFSYYHGLYGKTLWDKLSHHCCNDLPPARGKCSVNGRRSFECSKVIMQVTDSILGSGINPYNLYDKCAQVGQVDQVDNDSLYKYETNEETPLLQARKANIREKLDRQLMLHSLNLDYEDDSTKLKSTHLNATHRLKDTPPCVDESPTVSYVNQKSVRRAIHIPDFVQDWDICSLIDYTQQYPGRPDGLAPQMKQLLGSPRKLRLLVYNGDVDMMCNFFGDEWFVDDLGQKVIKDYEPWFVDNQVAGYIKHYEGIAYMTVKGSGHMVPEDKPKESFEFYKLFLSKKHA